MTTKQNRMTTASTFSEYAACLRQFMAQSLPVATASSSKAFSDDQQFNALALALFALQYGHNAVYRRLCIAQGASPASVSHWMDIPSVPTSAFKEFELTSLSVEERTAEFHSSGTTGQHRSRHFHSADSLALYEDSLVPWFEAQVLTDCDPLLNRKACQLELLEGARRDGRDVHPLRHRRRRGSLGDA